jgi:FkbH-like protein
MPAEAYLELPAHPRIACNPVTAEGSARRAMYIADSKRKEEEAAFQGPADHFLRGLQMEFAIFEADASDLQRAEELTVRTNQLNATGIPYSYDELAFYQSDPGHKLYMCELTDKYGSYGKIGLALVDTARPEGWHLKLLLMSCRVMSRGVGTIFLNYIMRQAKQDGERMTADFRLTGRNKQMFVAYRFAGFAGAISNGEDTQRLVNDLSAIQPYPVYVRVVEGRQPFIYESEGRH